VARAEPIATSERTLELDVLRGVALFGVLTVNLLTDFRVDLFETFMPGRAGSPMDVAIDRFVALALESKAFMAFAFVFGAGLAVQRERRGEGFARYVVRRQIVLLAIGLVHMVLVWNGDILTLYALLGLVAAPLVGWPPWLLVALAAALCAVYVFVPFPTSFATVEEMQRHVRDAHLAYGGGGFSEVLAFRVREIRPFSALLFWSAPRTLALFLLGACAWRAGLFRRPREHRRLLVTVAAGGVGVGSFALVRSAGTAAGLAGAIALALGYCATLLVLLQAQPLRRALGLLAPLGRMALTSYVLQSIVFGFVFYGYGLAYFGRMATTQAAILGVLVYVAQAFASAAWLARFRFGPLEWVWRSLTYGAPQPMRK
jgi:uncharacterized protein